MPEARLACPVPSRSTATKTWVSLVSRWISALRMVVAGDRAEGLDEARILVGGSDGQAQAVCEERVGGVEVADQYTTRFQPLERGRRILHARQDEVRRRRE